MSSISEEEDSGPTLKELVTKTLEANGVLGRLQAQLRASVFLILEEECHEKKIPLINTKAQTLLSSPNGKLAVSLVQDLLHCLNLDFTLSVFNPESKSVAEDPSEIRTSLTNTFGATAPDRGDYPYLLHLLDELQSHNKLNVKSNSSGSSANETSKQSEQNGEQIIELESVGKTDDVNGQQASLKKPDMNSQHGSLTNGHDTSNGKDDTEISPRNSESSQSEKDTLAGLEKEYEEEFSSSTSINNLPKETSEQSSSKDDPTLEGPNPEDQDTAPETPTNGDNSLTEEIEEDIEDILSSNSEVSNKTKDVTVSTENNAADYQESL